MSKSHESTTLRWKFVLAVFAFALACRLLPYVLHQLNAAGFPIDPNNSWYPWNFSPVAAACVFGAAVIPQRSRLAIMLAVMMIGGDLLIDLITGFQWWTVRNQFVQLWVYACVLLVAGIGRQIRSQPCWRTGVPAAMLSEGVFFVITNYAVWLSGLIPSESAPLYATNSAGLTACYLAALPFFGRSLISTAVYAGMFFSPWGLGLAGVEPSADMAREPALEAVRR